MTAYDHFGLSLFGIALALTTSCASSEEVKPICEPVTYGGEGYVICAFDRRRDDIRLFLNNDQGEPYMNFMTLAQDVETKGGTLSFAMNAGMYRQDRSPVGLYIEGDYQGRGLQTKAGPGNFALLPNGVFSIEGERAYIRETGAYKAADPQPEFATQSGPMLVIDGKIHPEFNQGSTSKYKRNGVGVSADGQKLYFAISDKPVNFHDFASLFKIHLKTPNALYFDGAVSKLYAPEIGRADFGLPMGPMVGVVVGQVDKTRPEQP